MRLALALTSAALARAAVPGPQQPLTRPQQALTGSGDPEAASASAPEAPEPPQAPGLQPLTLYQRLQRLSDASHFAKAVDEHPAVVKLLNGTGSRNYTLFVPTNDALKHHHDHDGKPSPDVVERLLRYHVAMGAVGTHDLLLTHTLPTALDEDRLGGKPQRLRASVGLGGVRLNFYAALVDSDMRASNGILHTINHVLVPPLPVGPQLELLPSRFSTMLLAYEKTDFVKYIHSVPLAGSTVFAPDNTAFARLGFRANAFLFNTDEGRRCLFALLKYQIAPNATLYSDAYYDETGGSGPDSSSGPDSEDHTLGREHYDLPTLLGDARVGVDIIRVGGLSVIRVNGFASIVTRDAVAKNGVIQVVDRVLLPPRKDGGADDTQHVDVEDLKERLAPYVG